MVEGARSRCPTHDLALGPDGECLLCRRTTPPAFGRGRSIVVFSVVGVALAAAAIGGHLLFTSHRPAPAIEVRPEPTRVAILAPPRPPAPRERRARTPGASPWAKAAQAARPSTTDPSPPSAPEPTVAPPPTEAPELVAARRRVSIDMYSTSWCGACAQARAYLSEHHVRFTDHDVDRSERDSDHLHELNPRGTIPTFEIDDQVLVGFGASSFESAVDRAAASRVARYR